MAAPVPPSSATAAPVETPAPADQTATPKTPRPPLPRLKLGPLAAIAGLITVLVVLVAVTVLGWKWGLLLTAGLVLLAAGGWVLWRRLRAGRIGRPGRGRSGGGRVVALRSHLPRFLGGTGRRSSSGRTSGRTSGSGRGASGKSGGLRSRLLKFLGGTRSRGRTSGSGSKSTPGAGGGRSGRTAPGQRGGGLLGRLRRRGKSTSGRTSGSGRGASGATSSGTSGPGGKSKKKRKGNTEHSTDDPGIDAKVKPTDKPAKPDPAAGDEPTPPDRPAARPDLADPPADKPASSTGGPDMGQHTTSGGYEDQSLVAAGESLKTAPNEFEELRVKWEQNARSAEEDQPFGSAVREGHNEIVKKLREIEEIAGALYGDYRGGNEADVERYENPRGGNHRVEGKADVQAAQRDN